MSVIELRKEIINKLNKIEDEGILKEIYDLIALESETEPLYKLTNQERHAIEEGLKDMEEGRVVSSEKAIDLIQEWLKK